MNIELYKSGNQEILIRQVSPVGNGAHTFVPREWIGEKITLIRIKSSLKERILDILKPHLENIIGAYLFGSHARKEAREDSDVDVLIISSKKMKIKEKNFEIISLEKNKIQKAIKIAPILIYSALSEAKPIINAKLLDELKETYKPQLKDFKEFIQETKRIIEINKEVLDPYSIILRLRGIYIIKELLAGKVYSNKGFRNWILKNLKDIDFDSVYKTYVKIKKGFKANTEEKDLKLLLLFLKFQTNKLKQDIYCEKKKKN